MFWNKRKEPDLTDLSEEIKSLRTKINRIETDILDLIQGQVLIRDKIMRKIRLKEKDVEETENFETWGGIPKTKEINKSAL